MKTMQSFIKQSNLPESLIRGVVKQVGGWQSFKDMASDVTNHGADGGFSGFCYYSDTVPFAMRHKAVILDYAKQMADDLGEPSGPAMIAGFNCLKDLGLDGGNVAVSIYDKDHEDHTQVMNALAWFALEEVSRAYDDAVQS